MRVQFGRVYAVPKKWHPEGWTSQDWARATGNSAFTSSEGDPQVYDVKSGYRKKFTFAAVEEEKLEAYLPMEPGKSYKSLTAYMKARKKQLQEAIQLLIDDAVKNGRLYLVKRKKTDETEQENPAFKLKKLAALPQT